jgi:hypothetical protein
MNVRHGRQRRSGNVLVLTAILMIAMFGMLALAVDIGYLHVVRTQLQSSADAAALAATWDLIDEGALGGSPDPYLEALAEATARQYASLNPVAGVSPTLSAEDLVIGRLANPFDPNAQITFGDPSRYNAIEVNVRRTAGQNGEVALFFARVLGIASSAQQAEATAVFLDNISGFTMPSSGENLCILPFALDEETWIALENGTGTDSWGWNEESGQVTGGGDGILEANLYPEDGLPSAGNRGTVDFGSDNNSTADTARQITEGLSAEDLEYHGGSLQLGADGTLALNGDTGISAGVKDELATVIGEKGIIPIFREVSGPGNNAVFTIVKFVGVRVMEVELNGNISNKRVMIQPASVTVSGAIVNTGETQTSSFIYSPVWLIR